MNFQRLDVYKKSKQFQSDILSKILSRNEIEKTIRNDLKRSSESIAWNIEIGCKKFSKAERGNRFTIASASAYDCVAIQNSLCRDNLIERELLDTLASSGDEISRMLFGLENKLM